MIEAAGEIEAIETLHAMGCTDGLPVVVPTPDRVDALCAGVDLDPDQPLGVMGPRQGVASVGKVAISAVMAGCLPEHFPVVLAAVRAVCREEFDLTEVNQTTHCLAPLIVVNGPARHACGDIESGAGILGPGNRASASIGRALSLAIINIGGRRPGSTDLAVFSSPGKFTACFAEAEERSPFAPWHTENGFNAGDSVATVVAVEAPTSVIVEPSGDCASDALRLIRALALTVANPGSNHLYRQGDGGVVVVINPEHADILAAAGYDRASICAALREHAVYNRAAAAQVYGGLNFVHPDDGDELHALRDASQLMLLVAGGLGCYSLVMPSWAYAPSGGLPVSERISVDPVCELPFQQHENQPGA